MASHLIADKPEVLGTQLPALLWTTPPLLPSHSSRAFRKEKLYSAFYVSPAFNEEADR